MKVIVIGAGIVGVTAALTLAEGGAEVVVLERGTIAGAASGLNAGVIGGGGWGDKPTVLVALRMGSRERYLDLAQNRGHDIGLDQAGTLTLIRNDSEFDWAASSVAADRSQGHSYELVTAEELIALEPAADPTLLGALFDPLGTRAEPVAATMAFASEARAAGATITTGSEVTDLRAVVGGGWELTASSVNGSKSAVLGADAVVIAAGPWCAPLGVMVGVDVPIVGVRGQMWASAPQPRLLRHAIGSAESYEHWILDSERALQPPDLTHRDGERVTRHLYGRQRPNGEIVFGGDRVLTNDRTVDGDGIAVNHGHVAELVPAVAELAPTRTWAGTMPFTLDGLPIIGPIAECPGLYLASGLASAGFGRGPMTGQLIADLVLGRDPGYDMTVVLPAGRVTP